MIITSLHSLSKWYDIPCASHEANQYICSKNAHLSPGEKLLTTLITKSPIAEYELHSGYAWANYICGMKEDC